MTDELQAILKDALINNTYDYQATHDTIRSVLESSFSYLYTTEQCNIGYSELFYDSNDTIGRDRKKIGKMYYDGKNACFDTTLSLIIPGKRELFYKSPFYKKTVTFQDIINHRDIFVNAPILLIDNQVIWDYSIELIDNITKFILPFNETIVYTTGYGSNTPILMKGTVYTIDSNANVTAVSRQGNYLNLDYDFLPARVSKVRDEISYMDDDESIPDLLAIIHKLIDGYYNIDFYSNEKIVISSIAYDVVYCNHKVQLLTVDNTWCKRIMVNRNTINFNQADSTITIPKELVGFENKEGYKGTMICSIHVPNAKGLKYELGTEIIELEEKDDEYVTIVSDKVKDLLKTTTVEFYMSFFFINRLHQYKNYKNEKIVDKNFYMVFERDNNKPYELPIPESNCLILRDSGNGYEVIRNVENIQLFYPNIYKIKDTMDSAKYKVFYFYDEVTSVKYTPAHELYHWFLTYKFNMGYEEVINKIMTKTINLSSMSQSMKVDFFNTFERIINYIYFNHRFGDMDFTLTYMKQPENDDKTPIEYKIEKMKEWVRQDEFMLRDYVLHQNHKGNSFHLFVNTFNLAERLRRDTSQELDSNYKFDEDMYVFGLSNSNIYPLMLQCRVFVDGIFIGDMYQERNYYMDYIYIPTRYVRPNSYIEVEIFDRYEMEEEFTFTDMDDVKTFSILEEDANLAPTIADVVVYSPDKTKRYDSYLFNIVMKYDDCNIDVDYDDEVSEKIKFSHLVHFTIQPKSEGVINVPLVLHVTKINEGAPLVIKETGYPYVEVIEKGFACKENSIRIFVNGRLLPKQKYKFYGGLNRPRIKFYQEYNVGDVIYFDLTPYNYTEVFYQKELTSDIVDLRGHITKPFDIRYYDVYLNGRKMSLNNIVTIDPWSFRLFNIDSKYNLIIFEKDRDYEYYGLDYTEHIYYFSVDDLLNESYVTENDRQNIIDYITDRRKDPHVVIRNNTNSEEIQDYEEVPKEILYYCEFDTFYVSQVLGLRFMNPDVKQLSEKILKEEFSKVYENYFIDPALIYRYFDEGSRREGYTKTMCLNPDYVSRVPVEDDSEASEMVVYTIGQKKATYQILQEHIEIAEEPEIDF